MVYFSNREKIILHLITQKSEGVMMEELIRSLKLSRRTIYRELASLESSLQGVGIVLIKADNFYQLRASPQQLAELRTQIGQNITLEWSDISKRKIAILAKIALISHDSMSYQLLANEFQLSMTTISDTITKINQDISKYNFGIIQDSNNQLTIQGNESYIRLFIGQMLTQEINEFDFYQCVKEQNIDFSVNTESLFLIEILQPVLLKDIYQSMIIHQPEIIENLSDLNLMNFVINIAVSILRLRLGNYLSKKDIADANKLLPYVNKVLKIVKELDPNDKTLLTTSDISFIAMHLRGMNLNATHSIFQKTYDMELGYSVKNLIKLISDEYHYNFNLDNRLYHDLINHIGSALKRIDIKLPEIENTVIVQLKSSYSQLYQIIEEKLIEVFAPTIFSEQEIGYIVVHFASSIEKYGKINKLNVLVVCTNGLGTSKILQAKLEKTFPQINSIDVIRTVDLINVSTENYALILSTIPLQGIQTPYYLINTLLSHEDIKLIQSKINEFIKSDLEQPTNSLCAFSELMPYDNFQNFYYATQSVINNFEIINIENRHGTLEKFIIDIITKKYSIANQLIERISTSPLLIPDTGLLLLHTIDDQLTEPIIKFYHLEFPIETLDMNNVMGKTHRIILMLGAPDMLEITTDFLGNFSASLIENQEFTRIYQEGDCDSILNLIKIISMNTLRLKLT